MAQRRQLPTQTQTAADLYFGPFRVEGTQRLWQGDRLMAVRPRPLTVLRYLAERPGQIITSKELLKRIWPDIYVTKTVLRVCVRELRQALEEDPIVPRFIETVGRQGYRFIASLTTTQPEVNSQYPVASSPPPHSPSQQLRTANGQRTTYFVGRERELARLRELFERVRRGERQTVFLFGEPGIGKTTLVDRLLDQVRGDGQVRIGRGQCIEHYGPGEAYLPLLEALGQLCKGPHGEEILAVLRRYAPLWLVQFAGLLPADEQEAVQRQVQSSGQERMLREFAEAVEALAADSVLVLVLEDLQWSDGATLAAIEYLAQRRRSVQVYILGTYRSADVVVRVHPLRQVVQELAGRRQCEELGLDPFTEAEAEEYLVQRFGRSAALTELSQLLYRRPGNALFW